MKVALFAFLLVAVGASAFPQQNAVESETRQQRLVTDTISRMIQDLIALIVDSGLDPYEIERIEWREEIVPIFVTIEGVVDTVSFTGLSNIVINQLSFGILTNRLQFTVSLPQLALSIGDASMTGNIFGATYFGELRGTTSINNIRLIGDIRVNIGIISGITIRSLALNFRLGSIASDLTVFVQGENYSDVVNTFLTEAITGFIQTYQTEIDQILTDIVRAIADAILSSNIIGKEYMVMQ